MSLEQQQHSARIAASLIRDHRCATPFLFLDESEVSVALGRLEEHLSDARIFYAVKANPAPQLISYFAERGLSFDVASLGEIELMRRLRIPGEKLFLSTPIKSLETIEAMFAYRIGAFAIDTQSEIERIASYRQAHRYAYRPKVFVRIRVESKDVEVDLNTKFGCSIAEALEIVARAADLGFNVAGICFHVGTQSTNANNYFLGIRSAMLVAEEALRRFGIHISVINIGGGFCDPLTAKRIHLDLNAFYREVGLAVQQAVTAGYQIYAEPGRCLVSAAGTLVTSVLGTNVRNGRSWAYLDDGIYGCYSIKLYENHPFEFYPVNYFGKSGKSDLDTAQWTVAGPTCDSLDVISEEVLLPATLRGGDVLLTPNLGAYSLSTASNFNGFRQPDCFLVRSTMKGTGKVMAEFIETAVPMLPAERSVNA